MRNCYEDDDREGEGPLIRTQAELTLQNLLEKQLSTTRRLERVEFEEVTHNMCCIGHGFSGIGTLAQFREHEVNQKEDENYEQSGINLVHRQRFLNDVNKRKRYGPDPTIPQYVLEGEKEQKSAKCLKQSTESISKQRNWSRHTEELEASLMRGKEKLKSISHLSTGESASRKPLLNNIELSELYKGSTPQERAHDTSADVCKRSVTDVFSSPAPDILDLHIYLEGKHHMCKNGNADMNEVSSVINDSDRESRKCKEWSEVPIPNNLIGDVISETEILSNKLSDDQIRQMHGGKFSNYEPGIPSNILYIKNLSSDVKETDLVALFIRFESPGKKLLFRLLQHGRMKGQAFITFPDAETATRALLLINGFQFKGKPMIIHYGRKEVGSDKNTK